MKRILVVVVLTLVSVLSTAASADDEISEGERDWFGEAPTCC